VRLIDNERAFFSDRKSFHFPSGMAADGVVTPSANYTLTNLADHLQVFSHDTINRYLRGEKLTPRLLWDNVEHLIQLDENGSIIFDDTVIDKNCSNSIELVRDSTVVQSIG
jgi:hypothetical protein